MINMRHFESEIQKLVYDEYGEELDKKDETIEKQSKELKKQSKELKKQSKQINKLKQNKQEFKKKLKQLAELDDLNSHEGRNILEYLNNLISI